MVVKRADLRVEGDLALVVRLCEEALMASGAGLTSRDVTAGRLSAVKCFSWRSWGENLSVDVSQLEPRACTVRISSKSSLGTTLVDWGKNRDNLNRFIRALGDGASVAVKQTQ